MKISLFQANQGDCLLVRGQGGANLLVDGGMKGSYKDHVARDLGRLASDGEQLDLICVSHIDNDHISGIVQFVNDLADWRVYEYQIGTGNSGFPKPKRPRPPQVGQIWHNAFQDQVQDDNGTIENQLVANMKLFNMSQFILTEELASHSERYSDMVTGVREGLILSNRISRSQLDIPNNVPFGGELIQIEDPDDPPPSENFGGMEVLFLGPFQQEVEDLRAEWNEWLDKNQQAVEEIRRQAAEDAEALPIDEGQLVASHLLALATELGDRDAVTTPNLASIMLLLEEGGKTVLLTGDGHGADLLKGLKAHGKLDAQGRLHVEVLKLQHHGSEFNIDADFCKAITADHYVICANGAHHNPDLEVLRLIINSRLGEDAEGPHAQETFWLWFNSSVKMAGTEKRVEHMTAVEAFIRDEARKSGLPRKLRYRFLTQGSKLEFEI